MLNFHKNNTIQKILYLAISLFALHLPLEARADEKSTIGCGSGDLSGITLINCSGYTTGNLLNNSPSDVTAVKSIFSSLGFGNSPVTWTEKLNDLKGTNTIDFVTPLNGISIIGIHKGGAGSGTEGTAFYVVNAGTNLNTFKYNLSGSSDAVLYAVSSPIPEPSSYALMIIGLCVITFIARRRKASPIL